MPRKGYVPKRTNRPGQGRKPPDPALVKEAIDLSDRVSPEEAATKLREQGKKVSAASIRAWRKGRNGAPPLPGTKPDPPTVIAERPPEGLTVLGRRLWYIERRIEGLGQALAEAEAKGELARINGLSGQLQKWLDDLQKYAPPEPADPRAEERRWQAASDRAVGKVKVGVAAARERMGALLGRPFPGNADVGAG